jgi:hypothetical protein
MAKKNILLTKSQKTCLDKTMKKIDSRFALLFTSTVFGVVILSKYVSHREQESEFLPFKRSYHPSIHHTHICLTLKKCFTP